MEQLTLRDAFWNRIYELALENRDIIVVSADMGAPALDKFKRSLGSQYVDVGIAEQQALGVAAGLALGGKKVFAYAIAPFISLRCYEHVRVELAMMDIPVTLVGVGAGFSYDDSGPTHHAIEDLAAIRIFPKIQVTTISDTVMASAFAGISCSLAHPNYVRLDRHALAGIYSGNEDFTPGLAVLRTGADGMIIANGFMVHRALEVSRMLSERSIDMGVMDLYTLPADADLFMSSIQGAPRLFTLEEHTLTGGLGSAVCEILADRQALTPVKRIGLDLSGGYCYKYGGRNNIHKICGLDADSVAGVITNTIGRR